jgi:hypothetical protein
VVRKVLSKVNQGCLFLIGLLKKIKERLIIKFKVDNIKPKTYLKFEDFLLTIYKVTKSSLISQALEL